MASLLQYLETLFPVKVSTLTLIHNSDSCVIICSLVPVPTSRHGAISSFVPCNLQQARFVFIHRDAHRTPLQRPYDGPFKVIQPGPKAFQVDIGGKTETISVHRLKLAHMDLEYPAQVAEPRHRGRPHKHPQPPPRHTARYHTHGTPNTKAHIQDVTSSHHNGTSRFWGE